MAWTEEDLKVLIEVAKEAVENALAIADEPDEVLEKDLHAIITEYADNQFTDLHEYADGEIVESFTTEDLGGGQGHIEVMMVADKWCGGTFIKDFREMHKGILK
jgi:hypothetical protein